MVVWIVRRGCGVGDELLGNADRYFLCFCCNDVGRDLGQLCVGNCIVFICSRGC